MNAILIMFAKPCRWRQMTREITPFTTARECFDPFRPRQMQGPINHALVRLVSDLAGQEPTLTAAIAERQWEMSSEASGARLVDVAEQIEGRKCHVIAAALEQLLALDSQGAHVQRPDRATSLKGRICGLYLQLRYLGADGAHPGAALSKGSEKLAHWMPRIVKRTDVAEAFEPLPRRWALGRGSRRRRFATNCAACTERALADLVGASCPIRARHTVPRHGAAALPPVLTMCRRGSTRSNGISAAPKRAGRQHLDTPLPMSAKLNPKGHVPKVVRETRLSPRIFSPESLVVDRCGPAWNRLIDESRRTMSLVMCDWLHGSEHLGLMRTWRSGV